MAVGGTQGIKVTPENVESVDILRCWSEQFTHISFFFILFGLRQGKNWLDEEIHAVQSLGHP